MFKIGKIGNFTKRKNIIFLDTTFAYSGPRYTLASMSLYAFSYVWNIVCLCRCTYHNYSQWICVLNTVIFFLFGWYPMFYLGSSTNSLRLLAFHNASHSDLSSVPPCPGTWPGVFCFHREDASSWPFSSPPAPAGFPRFSVSLLTVVQWIQFI